MGLNICCNKRPTTNTQNNLAPSSEREISPQKFTSANDSYIDEIETIAEGEWDIKWIAEGNGDLCTSSSDYEFKNGGMVDGITMTALRLEVEYDFPKQETVKNNSESGWMTNT